MLRALACLTDPTDELQLTNLDAALQRLTPNACGLVTIRALLNVFERFPLHDGFGAFWSVVHAIERSPGYEAELLASVQKSPCEFNITMLFRLMNDGVVQVQGQSLRDTLNDVLCSTNATQSLKDDIVGHFAN